jgi:hypothetical protein
MRIAEKKGTTVAAPFFMLLIRLTARLGQAY